MGFLKKNHKHTLAAIRIPFNSETVGSTCCFIILLTVELALGPIYIPLE